MKTGIWNTLEALAEGQPPAAVLEEWRRLAGADFEALGSFLRTTQRRARDYPCLAELRCGCRHELVELDDDRWLARCECEMSGCDAARLTTDDLWIHELDALRFGNTVAGALGFEATGAAGLITAAPNVWPAGIHGETRSPVFLFLCPDQGRMLANLEALAGNCGEPFIVLAPTARARSEVVGSFLQRERCAFIPLSSVLELNGEKFTVIHPVEPMLREFERRLVGGDGLTKAVEKIGRDVEAVRKEMRTASQSEPVDENVARQLFALVKQLESERAWRKAPILQVFRLYCMEGLSRDQVAKECGCVPSLVSLRLQQLEKKVGRKPTELRQFSSHFERIEDSLSDSRARRIHRRGLVDEYGDHDDA
jgi:hypothetical protein